MDPLLNFAKRNSEIAALGFLSYDARFLYLREGFVPDLRFETSKSDNLNGDEDLFNFLNEQLKSIHVPKDEVVVLDRANPFLKVAEDVIGNADHKALDIIFNFKGYVNTIYPGTKSISNILRQHFQTSNPSDNFIMAVGDMMDEIWLHFTYLMSKLYKRITILKPMISTNRYLICINFQGYDMVSLETIAQIISKGDLAVPLTRIWGVIPNPFIRWIRFINNTYMGISSEMTIRVIESKLAFDNDEFYWPGASYDILKLTRLLNGLSTEPEIINPWSMKRSLKTDEKFVYSMHLYGEPTKMHDDSTQVGSNLHTIIDLDNDERMDYESTRAVQKGGSHWGQRKLLLAEFDFFTQNTNPNEKTVAFYMGACPFKHGSILAFWFPDVNFWLCDPRNLWDKDLKPFVDDGRMLMSTCLFDETFAKEIALYLEKKEEGENMRDVLIKLADRFTDLELNQNGKIDKIINLFKDVKNFLFLSDIRSVDPTGVGTIEHELAVHDDMQLQMRSAEIITKNISPDYNFVASFKFRVPFIEEIGGSDYFYGGGILKPQPWARMSSTELRLWWSPKDGKITYNKKAIEDVMMYHNTILRSADFGPLPIDGYGSCHDCHYEVMILYTFVKKFHSSMNIDKHVERVRDDINRSLGKTLDEHAKKHHKSKFRLFDFKVGTSNVLKFDPLKEIDRSRMYFKLRADFVKLINKLFSTEALAEAQLKESIETVFNDFIIYKVMTRSHELEENDDKQLFPTRATDMENNVIALKMIIESILKKDISLNQSSKLINQLNEAIIKDIIDLKKKWLRVEKENPTIEIQAHKIFGDNIRKKGFYKITVGSGEGTVSTIGFHKNLFRIFLAGYEKEYGVSDYWLRTQRTILFRAFVLLKRYGNAWNDHFGISLNYETVGKEFPGFIIGSSLFSSERIKGSDANFAAIYPDLELHYTKSRSLFMQKSRVSKLGKILIDSKISTVFLPNIRPLYIFNVDIWLNILKSNSDKDITVVFITPQEIEKEILKTAQDFVKGHVNKYTSGAFDYIDNTSVSFDGYVIIILGTESSSFRTN